MDKTFKRCLMEYAKNVDGDRNLVIAEALNSGKESVGGVGLVDYLEDKIGLPRDFICKTLNEASRYKKANLCVHQIAEDIEENE